MIKNVIFDLGNVVLKLKWEKVLNRYSDNEAAEYQLYPYFSYKPTCSEGI